MKKIYMQPEMEIVEIKHQQTLLAGSAPVLDNTDDFGTEDPILAPGLDVGPSIPGLPGFVFE